MANVAGLDAFKENQETAVVDASKKVKIGIIGTGWIAKAHMQAYLQMPDVEIVAGADLIPGKAEAFFENNGFTVTQTVNEDNWYAIAAKRG